MDFPLQRSASVVLVPHREASFCSKDKIIEIIYSAALCSFTKNIAIKNSIYTD